jgi:hypothetical protein
LTENFRRPFFLIKRKLKNTSSRGTHHLITRAQKKKNDDDENDDDDFEENDFDSSLPLRRELFVFWDFNCFCRPGIPRQRAFLCVVFFLDHFSQNHHRRRVLAALFVFFVSSSRSPKLRSPSGASSSFTSRSVCLSVGVDLGLKKGVSLESSSSVSSFRRKRRIGGKNGFFSMMLGRTPTTSSKLSFRGVRKILTTKMFVSLL